MKYILLALFMICGNGIGQSLYFPPVAGEAWDTIATDSLGWDPDALQHTFNYLEEKNTKAFIILKDGKIAVEWYFNSFGKDSLWYWASAGKTITAFLIGKAQEEGLLSIQDKTSQYLGPGWTAIPGGKVQTEKVDCIVTNPNCQLLTINGDAPYQLPNGAESPFTGYADPCVRKDPQGDTLWLGYSWPYYHIEGENYAPGVDIHLANSTNSGKTWNFSRALFVSQKIQNPDSMSEAGYLGQEVVNFIPYSYNDERGWISARLNYFVPTVGGFKALPYTSFHIRVSKADSIYNLSSGQEAVIGGAITSSSWHVDHYLSNFVPELKSKKFFWNEPALFFEDSTLYLTLSAFVFDDDNQPLMSENNIHVFSTIPRGHPKEWDWRYHGILIDALIAEELGGERMTQGEIAKSRDGKIIFLATPDDWDPMLQDYNHKGCKVLEIKSLKKPEFVRDDQGKLVVWAEIFASDAGPLGTAAAGYDPNLQTGVIFTKREKSKSQFTAELWSTNLTPKQVIEESGEDLITIRHQLTMTTGLDDRVSDPYCTQPECLIYKADAGSRWAYHNAPYTLLRDVIEAASGMNENLFTYRHLTSKIGMNGNWIKSGFNNVYFSNARSMARFGLLALNHFVWDGDTLLSDQEYIHDMIHTSQELNQSYGYLWWLNGKKSHMLPGLEFVFQTDMIPNAPDDLIAALGKNDQKLYVVKSLGLVVVRMGESAEGVRPALSSFDNELWGMLMQAIDNPTEVTRTEPIPSQFKLEQNYPNPFNPTTTIRFSLPKRDYVQLKVFNALGQAVTTLVDGELNAGGHSVVLNAHHLPGGLYLYQLKTRHFIEQKRLVVLK